MPASPAGRPPGDVVTVLVVDDAPETRLLVARALERAGLVAEEAATIGEAREKIRRRPPAVVILDVELPDGSGFELLREITGGDGTPVVMLTGRANEGDRVHGLELGAADYVVKPFFPRELALRVRRAAAESRHRPHRLVFPGLTIDAAGRRVELGAEPVELTRREFDLLVHLACAPGRVFARDELLRDVWRSSPEWQSPKTVTEHVRRLRQKLEDDPERPCRIVTVGNAGYRFEAGPANSRTTGTTRGQLPL